MTQKEIEEQIEKTEERGEKVYNYLQLYKGDKMYNEIALAIEFGYQLCLDETL